MSLLRYAPCVVLFARLLSAQEASGEVLAYPLPHPLVMQDGRRVTDARVWTTERRPEIMQLFAGQVYGRTPSGDPGVHWRVDSVDTNALDGKALRKQITVYFAKDESGPVMHLLLYLPTAAKKRAAVFLGLNFRGNQAVANDSGVELNDVWVREAPGQTGLRSELSRQRKQRADENTRGAEREEWQVEKILSRGFGLATAYYGDIEPDFQGGIRSGVRPLFFRAGQTEPAPDEWGALGAWAWGLSRALDYLQHDTAVDGNRVAVIGHSRLGKAALWAAAQDQRFRIVISNESGKGGASLYRAKSGETIEHLNTSFPYWFCGNFHAYTGRPQAVPVDGNLLLACMAPRPLYVASAEKDASSNPAAEFLSETSASRVYELLGKPGLRAREMPQLDHPVIGWLAYHVRSGKHDVTAFDWDAYLEFAEKHLHAQ